MLTKKQKMLLHMAPDRLGIDEAGRRTVQRNVGGFCSAADSDATHEGFVAVMAFWETRSGGCLDGFTPRYWQRADAEKNPTDRLCWRIRQEAAELALTAGQVDAFLAGKHMSGGRYHTVQEAPAYWLRRVLQALIEIRKRRKRQVG